MEQQPEPRYKFDSFSLDPDQRVLRRGPVIVRLTPKAFNVLSVLVRKANRIVGIEELMNAVWRDTFVEEGNVKVTVHMLRKALGSDARGRPYIETIPRRGYRFAATVTAVRVAARESQESCSPPSPEIPTLPPEIPGFWAEFRRRASQRTVWYAVILALVGVATFFATTRESRLKHNPAPARASAPPVIRSLAVLPLRNLSGDPRQDYFAAGMTDELITDLAQVRGIRVISETSAMRYKDSRESLRKIARELNVDAVVEGAVVRSKGEIRITAQLIDARTDMHLWAGSYRGEMSDVLSLQDEVAESITRAIRRRIGLSR